MNMDLSADDARAIDEAIWRHFKGRELGGSELSLLARLFSGNHFLLDLKGLLQSKMRNSGSGFSEEADVRMAWIDKRPYAQMTGCKRVEIGDSAIFYIQSSSTTTTASRIDKARAVILQAKVHDKIDFIPLVPVTERSKSTALQLKLLSNWPRFDLYQSTRGASRLANDVQIDTSLAGYAWFMATPRNAPTVSAQISWWRSPWMCGEPAQGASFNHTLGELMVNFLNPPDRGNPKPGQHHPGLPFKMSTADLNPGILPASGGWDRLCIELLRSAHRSQLPPYLFPNESSPKALKSISISSFPGLDFDELWEKAIRVFDRVLKRASRERFPVLIITHHMREEDRKEPEPRPRPWMTSNEFKNRF